jgi:DNA-directed RNA polymerase specialized sigma24 family protein
MLNAGMTGIVRTGIAREGAVSAEVPRPAAPDPDPESADGGRFAALFEAHAAHVYDYCYSLLGDRRDASGATQATLVTAYALVGRLQDTSRLRVFLFALARRKCLGEHPAEAVSSRSTWDSAADRAGPAEAPDTEEIPRDWDGYRLERAAVAALAAVPPPEREVLDLVYRHSVSPAELHAILGTSSDQAEALLAAAVAGFESADRASTGTAWDLGEPAAEAPAAGVAKISVVRLLALPPALWRRTVGVALHPELASYRESVGPGLGEFGPDGFAPPEPPVVPARKLVLKSALLGALLLAPATVGAILVTVFDPPPAISHAISDVLGSSPAPSAPASSQVPSPHATNSPLVHKKRAKTIILPVYPKASPTSRKPHPSPTTKKPSASASPSSSTPSPSSTATPTGSPTSIPTLTPTSTPTSP